MPATTQLSVTLTNEEADLVASKVASGEYADENDVIRDGLHVLADRDESVERWLRSTVAPVYDDVVAGRGTFMTGDEVRDSIRAELGVHE